MDNKKGNNNEKQTMDVKVVRLPDDQVDALTKAIFGNVETLVNEKLEDLNKKTVAVTKKDVKDSVREIMEEEAKKKEAKKEEVKKEETKKKAEPSKETEEEEDPINVVQVDGDADDKVLFSFKSALKYVGVGFLGAAAGVVGKDVYNRYDTRKKIRTAEENMNADNYEV